MFIGIIQNCVCNGYEHDTYDTNCYLSSNMNSLSTNVRVGVLRLIGCLKDRKCVRTTNQPVARDRLASISLYKVEDTVIEMFVNSKWQSS